MKSNYIKDILNVSLMLLFMYIIGCTISASFDITQWDNVTRVIIGIFNTILFAFYLLSKAVK